MASKYAEAAKRYAESTQFSGFGDKTLKFIGLSKKTPRRYVQILSDELMVVPMHNYIDVVGKNGQSRKMSFVCREFIDEKCYICDNKIDQGNDGRPKKRMIGLAIEFEKDGKRYDPVREDIVVSAEAGKKIAKKYPSLSPKIEDDRYTFKDMPRVGILDGNKSIDDDIALVLTETGSMNDCIFLIARRGEGLQTTYSAQRLSDSPIDFEDEDDELTQEVMAAIDMSMSVDDYIDTYIAEERYESAFNIKTDDSDDSDEDQDDEDDDEDDDDDDDDEVDMDEMFAKTYRHGRRRDS